MLNSPPGIGKQPPFSRRQYWSKERLNNLLKPQQESVAEKGGELKKSLAPSSGLSPQFIRPTCVGSFICDYKLEDQSIGSGKLNMF